MFQTFLPLVTNVKINSGTLLLLVSIGFVAQTYL